MWPVVPTYHAELVVLSVIVAGLASYATLSVAARAAAGRGAGAWLAGSGLLMGFGIWAMHFTAMLAFSLGAPVRYDLAWTAASWLAASLMSAAALRVVRRDEVRRRRLLVGGALLGLGIAAMHYVGMGAMRFSGGVRHDPGLVVLSVLVAVSASSAALGLARHVRAATRARQEGLRVAGALVLGLAIAGLHYVSMLGARFHLRGAAPHAHGAFLDVPVPASAPVGLLSTGSLAGGIGVAVAALLAAAVWSILVNERAAFQQQRLRDIERLNAELESRVAERTAALEEARAALLAHATAVTHDLAEPVRRVQGTLHLLARRLPETAADPKVAHHVALLRDEVDRVVGHVERLKQLPFFEGRAPEREPVALNVLLVQVRSDLEPQLRGRRVVWALGDLPVVTGDPMLLRLAFAELLANAVQAAWTAPTPRVEVRGERGPTALSLVVRTNAPASAADGAPVPALPGALARPHEGERVGLAGARRIVQMHGGALRTAPDGTVHVELPLAEHRVAAPAARPTADRAGGHPAAPATSSAPATE